LETSTGIHTLGRFECSGSMPFNDLPTSCKDLLFSGHTLKGFYSVIGFEMMETVYCDFVKLNENEGRYFILTHYLIEFIIIKSFT
jgi:hypothetical protein